MTEAWDTARIREAFIYDGGESEYHDPINGASEQCRIAGDIFDRWLAAHDARVRGIALAEAAQAYDGVVPEEPEWEYGATNVDDDRPVSIRDTIAEAREAQEFYTRERGRTTHLMMRKKAIPAGPWVPLGKDEHA